MIDFKFILSLASVCLLEGKLRKFENLVFNPQEITCKSN